MHSWCKTSGHIWAGAGGECTARAPGECGSKAGALMELPNLKQEFDWLLSALLE